MTDNRDVYLTPEQIAKQLQVATITIYRWLRGGKLRGVRVSQKAWRISQRDLDSFMKQQNVSELLFEQYLQEHRLGVPDYEPLVAGKSARIDYRLPFKNKVLWFEVKEFEDEVASSSAGPYDPYVGIRNKIAKAGAKFKDYDRECCSLVLYSRRLGLADPYQPEIVLGAMLGNVSVRIPIDFEAGAETGSPTTIFTRGGRLIHPYKKVPQNTTISAVIALEQFPLGQREFAISLEMKERELGKSLSWEESYKLIQSQSEAYATRVLRALVYENPYAKNPLPRDIFIGPFDERWGPDGQYIKRIYAGQELTRLENSEYALELDLGPLQRILKKRKSKNMGKVTRSLSLPDERNTIDFVLEQETTEKALALLLDSNLTDQQDRVIRSLYGLRGTEQLSYEKIAEKEMIPVDRVKEIENEVRDKMKNAGIEKAIEP